MKIMILLIGLVMGVWANTYGLKIFPANLPFALVGGALTGGAGMILFLERHK